MLFFYNNPLDCLARDIDPVVEQIQQGYDSVREFTVNIQAQELNESVKMLIEGKIMFKDPGKFIVDINASEFPGAFKINARSVYDGRVLWDQVRMGDKKNPNVMKTQIDSTDPQFIQALEEWNPKFRFRRLVDEYNIIDVRDEQIDGKQMYLLKMEIKPEVRRAMVQQLKAKTGSADKEMLIADKVDYFWDKESRFVRRAIEQSKTQEYVKTTDYSSLQVNAGLDESLFDYAPPEGVEIIDITEVVSKENAEQEYEGAQNKLAGRPFPGFELEDVFGGQYSLEQFKGRVLIVSFWETWCPPCIREMPLLESLHQEIYTDEHTAILSITTDKQAALAVVEENGYSLPVLIDAKAELADLLEVRSIPRTFVIDKKGMIAAVYIGYHQDIKDILMRQIKRLNPEEE